MEYGKRDLKWYVLLLLLLPGCFPVIVVKNDFPKEVIKACADFCQGSFQLHYRNGQTSFCECLDESGKYVRSVVMGSLGTLYR